MKFKVNKDLTKVSGRTDIVKDIQYKPFESNQPFGGPGAHNGGRMAFGPEGYLWVGTGDRHRGVCPQDNSLVCGVVLRIDADGKGHPKNKIKADNVFIHTVIEMFKVLISVLAMVKHLLLNMDHGITTKLLL